MLTIISVTFSTFAVAVSWGYDIDHLRNEWWRHQMEKNCRVTGHLCGEFTGHRWIPHTKASDAESFDVFFDLRMNKRLSKQSWGWRFETPSCSLWHNCNGMRGLAYHTLHAFKCYIGQRYTGSWLHPISCYSLGSFARIHCMLKFHAT